MPPTRRMAYAGLPAAGLVLLLGIAVTTPAANAADPLPVAGVTASGHDGNVPANTLDNNLATRWSAEGDGVWIRYDLGSSTTAGSIHIAWYNGSQRVFTFDVQTSTDAATWTTVISRRQSSGTTTQPESYDFTDRTARYVRIVGHGNTGNAWTSITEVDIYGATGSPTTTPTTTSPPPGGGGPAGAGLLRPVAQPSPVTGSTRSITTFGATPGNSADDDSTAIQNAINASSAGDEVLVPNGVFHLKTRRVELKSGVSVRGASRDGAVLHAAFNAVSDGKNSYVLTASPGVQNLTISNLTITSNGSTSGTSGLNYAVWLGNGDSACQECNFDIPAVHRIRVTGLKVTRYLKMGLNIRNGHDITMDNNLVQAALSDSGGGFGYGIMLGYDQTANNWIHHNTIEAGTGKMRHGILLQYRAHNNLVEHNIVRNLSEDGIDLHGEDEYANELRYNTVYGSARAGFGVGNTGGSTDHGASGPDNWIHHNEVYNSLKGLHLIMESHRTWIEFNNFHDNEEFGVQVYNGGGDNLTIRCNRINNNAVGIRLEESAGTLVECNDASANTSENLRVTGTASSYTIRRNDFRGAEVTRDSTSGTYTDNCEDGNGNATCLNNCALP